MIVYRGRMRRVTVLVALVLAAAGGLAACTSDGGAGAGADDDGAAAEDAGSATAGVVLTVTDAWVKAADGGMTGLFGTIVNATDEDVVVVTGRSAAAARVELHTMVMGDDGAMVMTPVEDGFVVPAGGVHELAPGGDHVMLMDLAGPLEPGAEVTVELVTSDGDSVEVTAVARTFAGGEEEYEPADG